MSTKTKEELNRELKRAQIDIKNLKKDLELSGENHKMLQIYRGMFNSIINSCRNEIESGESRQKCDKNGSYYFIPQSSDIVVRVLLQVKEFVETGGEKISNKSFLDAGCGIGNILLHARAIGFGNITGLEFDDKTIEIAKIFTGGTLRRFNGLIKKQDILTFEKYHKYDVLYFYRPFRDDAKQIKFEERLYNSMKIGAIVIPILKQHSSMDKDKRFKRIDNTLHDNTFVKVKGGNKRLKCRRY
jgi:SAM-dependent methyltransferase